VAKGDLSKKITVDVKGEILTEEHHQHMVDQLNAFSGEVTRVAREWAPTQLGAGAGAEVGWTWKVPHDNVN